MKILIINPPRVNGFTVVREERYEHKDVGALYPPLSLLYTAAMLEKHHYKLDFLDANGFNLSLQEVKNKIDEIKPEILITRCGFDTQNEDVEISRYAKEKYKTITIIRNKIIGDTDWFKKNFLIKHPYIDIFLNYEPDSMILSVIQHIEKQGIQNLSTLKGISYIESDEFKTTEPAELIMDLDELPFPAYHLLPNLKPYHTGVLDSPFATVATSRGCPFTCTFCAYRNSGYRVRSPENVVEELKYLKKIHGLKSFLFFDDVIGLRKGRFEKISELMIKEKLNLKWVACTRANLVNEEQLRLMKKAGCEEIAIGIESGDPNVLRDTTKGVTLDDIRNAAKLFKKVGILFYGLAIIGLPGETKESLKNTIKFIKEIKPFYTQFCFSTPFPNTVIYNYYKENNLILTQDWTQYSPLAPVPVIRTKELSKDELIEMRNYVYRKIILDPVYLFSKIRLFDWKWNIQGFFKIMQRIKAILFKKFIR